MKTYRAYLFDLYGTLVDVHTDESRPAFWNAVARFFTQHGAAFNGKTLRRDYLASCAAQEDRLRRAADPDALVEPDLRRVFADLYIQKGVCPTETLIRETALFFRRNSTTHLRAYAGAKELLAALRGRSKVVLLSNAQSCFTLPELDSLGLRDCFDRIRISSDVGFRKPDPRFFRTALADLGLDPSDCLMIGNDPVCDFDGAKSAGMDAFCIRSALSPQQDRPTEAFGGNYLDRMDLRRLRRLLLMPEAHEADGSRILFCAGRNLFGKESSNAHRISERKRFP